MMMMKSAHTQTDGTFHSKLQCPSLCALVNTTAIPYTSTYNCIPIQNFCEVLNVA